MAHGRVRLVTTRRRGILPMLGTIGALANEVVHSQNEARSPPRHKAKLPFMSQPGAPSRTILAVLWLLLGIAMVAVPIWLGWTRWTAILSGHPAMLVATMVCALGGLVAVAWSVATLILGDRLDGEGDSDNPARRTPEQLLRRA